jgi:FAD:protein FMN transferase
MHLPSRAVLRVSLMALWVLAAACKNDPASEADSAPAKSDRTSSNPGTSRAPAPAGAPSTEKPSGPPIRKDNTVFADTEMMGTRVSINVYVDPKRPPNRNTDRNSARDAERAVEAAFEEMARIESLLSEWKPHSDLSRFNAAAGGPPIEVSAELAEVLARSREIGEETGGHFDVTFHGVGQLWSFEPGAVPPSAEEIERKLPLVDFRAIEVDRETRMARLARPGMMVGLGAIGKGYAAERASATLKAHGFADHVVEAGGDTHASGSKGTKPWMVGVQNPDGRGVVGVLPAIDRSIVTSGDYQRFFEHEGRRYAHIIDPRTGWPIELERSPRSVTLVSSNPTDGDAYCTAVVVMGATEGLQFVESKPDLEAIIMTRSGELLVSSGLQDVFIPTTPEGKPLGSPPDPQPNQ